MPRSPSDPAAAAPTADIVLPVSPAADGLRLRIHVTPRAAIERIGDVVDTGRGPRLRISVMAAPHEGQANEAVIRLLARAWRLPKTALSVVAGAGKRDKTLAIRGDANLLQAKLAHACAIMPRGRP